MFHPMINVEDPTLQGLQSSLQAQDSMTKLFIGIIQILILNVEHITILEEHRVATRRILVQHELSLSDHRDLIH